MRATLRKIKSQGNPEMVAAWSEQRDIFIKLFLTGSLAGGVYFISRRFHVALFAVTIGLPAVLLVTHWFTRRIYIADYDRNIIIPIKHLTFIAQNSLICYAFYTVDRELLTLTINLFYKINVIEILIICIARRHYLYVLPSVHLLTFNFECRLDADYIFTTADITAEFVVFYTLWFLGWSGRFGPHRFPNILHTLLPLLFPASLWFTARTFTGINMLVIVYLKATFTHFIDTEKHQDTIRNFMNVYDALYLLLFPVLWFTFTVVGW